MKEGLGEISEGIAEYKKVKETAPDVALFEQMSEGELSAEYNKLMEDIKKERIEFKEKMDTEEEMGTDKDKTFIGGNKISMKRIEKLQEIMDDQGIPYEAFE